MKQSVISEVTTALLVLLWVYAGVSKLWDHELFFYQLQRLPVAGVAAPLLRIGLPVAELAIAGLLVTKRYRTAGLYASLVLLAVFTTYLGFALLFEKHLPCSCGGVISRLTWGQHLVFNALFMMAAGVGIRSGSKLYG